VLLPGDDQMVASACFEQVPLLRRQLGDVRQEIWCGMPRLRVHGTCEGVERSGFVGRMIAQDQGRKTGPRSTDSPPECRDLDEPTNRKMTTK